MAQIANVRRFTAASSEYIDVADGALEAAVEPFSIAAIIQPRGTDVQRTIFVGDTPFAWVFILHEFNGIALFNQDFSNSYSDSDEVDGSGWFLVGMTKAAGTTTPRFHIYPYATEVWNQYDSNGGTITAIATPSGSEFSIGKGGNYGNFDLAALGIWYGTLLSDANFQTLPESIDAWDALNPTAHWLFDQGSVTTPLADRSGNGSHEIGRSGTSVVTPTGLTFDTGTFQVYITSDADDGYGEREGSLPPSGAWTNEPLGGTLGKAQKVRYPTNYGYFGLTFLRFDTSNIPDDAVITGAELKLHVNSKIDDNGASVVADYYDFGGEPTVVGDYVETISSSIIASTTIASIVDDAVNTITLTDLTGISKTGYTGIRLGIGAVTLGADNDENWVEWALSEHATFPPPTLEVTYNFSSPPSSAYIIQPMRIY